MSSHDLVRIIMKIEQDVYATNNIKANALKNMMRLTETDIYTTLNHNQSPAHYILTRVHSADSNHSSQTHVLQIED
jgi:hypothetical protein